MAIFAILVHDPVDFGWPHGDVPAQGPEVIPERHHGGPSSTPPTLPVTKSRCAPVAPGDERDHPEEDKDAEHQGEGHEGRAHRQPDADEQDDEDERDEPSLPCDGPPSPAQDLRAEPGGRGVRRIVSAPLNCAS